MTEPKKGEPLSQREALQKKLNWKTWVSTGLFIVMVGLLALYVWKERQNMQKLLELSVHTILLMLALALGACLVNCLYHLAILKTYGLSLTLADWMGVVSVSNAIAYVLPMRADLVFSAAYYKRVKGLAYTKSVSMAAGNIVFGVVFSLLQIFAVLLLMGFVDGEWKVALWLLWALGTVATGVFIVFSLVFQEKRPKFLQKYKLLWDVVEGFNALLRNRRLLWQLLLCLIGNNLMQLLLYMVCFQAIGLPITYQALFYNSVSWLSSIVAIVPGNIGIKESAMGAATLLMGTTFPDGVAVSLLQRMAVMVIYLLMGLVFALPVYRTFTKEKQQKA